MADEKRKGNRPGADSAAGRGAAAVGAKWRAKSPASDEPIDDDTLVGASADPPAISVDAVVTDDPDVLDELERAGEEPGSVDDVLLGQLSRALAVAPTDDDEPPELDEDGNPISRPPSSLALLFKDVAKEGAHWESEPGVSIEKLRDEDEAQADESGDAAASAGDDSARPPNSLAGLFAQVRGEDARWESEPGVKIATLREQSDEPSEPGAPAGTDDEPAAPTRRSRRDRTGAAKAEKRRKTSKAKGGRDKTAALPKPPPAVEEDEQEAVRALLRTSGRPAAMDASQVETVDIPRPGGLPRELRNKPERAPSRPRPAARPSRATEAPAKPSSSRSTWYAVGLVGAALLGALLSRVIGADDARRAVEEAGATALGMGATAEPGRAQPGAGGDSLSAAGGGGVASGTDPLGPGYVPRPSGGGASSAAGAAEDAGAGEVAAGADSAEPDSDPYDQADPPSAETGSPAAPGPFDRDAARAALQRAAGGAAACPKGDISGTQVATVSVTFAPSGRVTTAVVGGGPLAGTAAGSCVAAAFRGISIPPFTGSFVTVQKTVRLP